MEFIEDSLDDDEYVIWYFDETKISLEEFKELYYAQRYALLHKEDGPSVIEKDEFSYGRESYYVITYKWFINGVEYREGNLPSRVIKKEETGEVVKEYYTNPKGQFHRLDGPSIVSYTKEWGPTKYWLWDKELTKKQYNDAMKYLKENGMEAFVLRYK